MAYRVLYQVFRMFLLALLVEIIYVVSVLAKGGVCNTFCGL